MYVFSPAVAEQAVAYVLPDLGADAKGAFAEEVHRLGDGAVRAVFNGDDAVVDELFLYGAEDLAEAGAGDQFNAVAEARLSCLVAPCAFGAEVGDANAAFELEGAADNLPVDALEACLGQHALVEALEFVEELAFALGNEEGGMGFALDLSDLVHAFGAAVQQLDDVGIKAVDFSAEFVQCHHAGVL